MKASVIRKMSWMNKIICSKIDDEGPALTDYLPCCMAMAKVHFLGRYMQREQS